MSDTPENTAPQPVWEQYTAPALALLKAAVKGNGVKPEDVQARDFFGDVAQFRATLLITLNEKSVTKTVGGKKATGNKVANAQAARDELEKKSNSIYGTDTERQIKQVILDRPDRGLGLKNEYIKMPFLTHEFMWHEPCQACRSQGEFQCRRCFGKGFEVCPRCNGQGAEICPACNGTQYIWNGNAKVQCLRCNGTGRTGCRTCMERRRIKCVTCKGKGSTICSNCNGQGWDTHILASETIAQANFDFDREGMDEKLVRAIENIGARLGDYGTCVIAEEVREQPQKDILITYLVQLPYGHFEALLGDKHNAYVFLVGRQGEIFDPPAFHDVLLKTGLEELKEAAGGAGNTGDSLRRAGKYRTLRQGIILSVRNAPARAVKILLKNNALGLSENTARTIISDATEALKKITGARNAIGMVAGAIAAAILYAIYFLTPVRTQLVSSIANSQLHPAADFITFSIGVMAAIFMTQIASGSALKKALEGLLSAEQKKSAAPRLGNKAYLLAAACLILFLITLETTLHTGTHVPEWYEFLRTQFTG